MKIYFIGFMGTGKTYWGRQLSHKLQIPFFDLDEQIISQEGKSINDIFSQNGEEYFRRLEKEALHIITESHDSFVMATGGGTPCYFNNIDYMKKSGTVVWINTSMDILFERLLKDKATRPLLKDLEDNRLKAYIIRKFADRKIYYEQADIMIDEESKAMDKILEKVFHA